MPVQETSLNPWGKIYNAKDLKPGFTPSVEPKLEEDSIIPSFPYLYIKQKYILKNNPFVFKSLSTTLVDFSGAYSFKKGPKSFVDYTPTIDKEFEKDNPDVMKVCFDAELLKSLKSALSEISLPELVAECLKEERDVNTSNVNYSVDLISLDCTHGFVDDQYHKKYSQCGVQRIYVDAPLGVCFFINNVPACVMGFYIPNLDGHCILNICQLQGVRLHPQNKGDRPESKTQERKLKPHSWALKPIDWPRLLVLIGIQLAEKISATSIQITGAKSNRWAQSGDKNLERFLKIYDGTAKRLGFQETPDSNWIREIRSIYAWQKLKALSDVSTTAAH